MNEQDDNGQGFRIKDRRRFDADGRERLAEADVDDGSQPADATPSPSDIGADRTGEIPVDFSTFILSLSTSALIHSASQRRLKAPLKRTCSSLVR